MSGLIEHHNKITCDSYGKHDLLCNLYSQYVVQNHWQKDSQEKRRSTFSSLRLRKKKAFGLEFNQLTKPVVQRDARSYVTVRFCKSFLKFKLDSLPW